MTDSVQLMLIPLEHWVSHEKSQYTVQAQKHSQAQEKLCES